MQTNNYTVAIQCLTFNHANYITDAMNGFTIQQTKFPFVCIIIEDASTDGEQEIIRAYLRNHFNLENTSITRSEETKDYTLQFARHKENLNCFFLVLYLKYNHHSNLETKHRKRDYIAEWYKKAKYIALCEGDDYWTDPLKLQKQVDYLENHPECGLVYTDYQSYNPQKSVFSITNSVQTNFEDLLYGNKIATLTTCYRSDLFIKFLQEINPRNKGWLMGDLPLWLYLSANSKIKHLSGVTATYRVLENSASHAQNPTKRVAFLMSGYYIDVFFAKKYGREYLLKDIAKARVRHLINDSYNYDQNLPFCFTKFFFQNSIFDFKLYVRSLTTHSRTLRKLHSFLISKRK